MHTGSLQREMSTNTDTIFDLVKAMWDKPTINAIIACNYVTYKVGIIR